LTVIPPSATLLQTQPWHGRAHLTYQKRGNKTVPLVQTQAPLKVQRPFYPEGPQSCHTVLLHTAGGMVGGDRLSINITLEADTTALVTTAAAAKIYSDHPQQLPTQIQGHIQVGEGACLEWLPQETIVFEGAYYHPQWRIDLSPGATWLGWDILRLGRTAHGERFTCGEVRSHLEVWQHQHPVWIDPQQILGSESLWSSPQALKQCPVLATFTWIGQLPERTWVQASRDCGQALIHQGAWGVTRLQQGLLCRYRGHSTSEAKQWFEAVWGQIRPHYLGQRVVLPRVWQR
jgi:urease accessory protein